MPNASNLSCVRLAMTTYMPYLYVGSGEKPTVSGSIIPVFDMIFGHLGMCYEFVAIPTRTGGIRLPNGSWTGAVGMLLSGEADMTATPAAVTYDRYEILDATEVVDIAAWTAGYRRPVIQSDLAGFIRPFSLNLWMAISATVMCVLFAIWIINMKETTVKDRRYSSIGTAEAPSRNEDASWAWNDSLFWTAAILLAQSLPSIPRGQSLRVVTGVWLLCSLILGTVYRSNLKAMLILPKVTLPFDSTEEMLESGIPIWMLNGAALHVAASKSQAGSSLARVLAHTNKIEMGTNLDSVIRHMLAGEHILTFPRAALNAIMTDTFLETGQCIFYIMSENLVTVPQSFLLPKNSPLTKKLNPLIRRLRESGILDHEYQKQFLNATECQKPIGSHAVNTLRPLDLGDFYGVLMLYGGGVFLALVSFVMELFLRRFHSRTEGN